MNRRCDDCGWLYCDVCVNDASEYCADYRDGEKACEWWEEKEDKSLPQRPDNRV